MRALKEAQILLGFQAPTYTQPNFTTAHIFSSILGGGMASRLFQEVRESRGLCYSIYSFYWPFTDTGVFGIQAATSEEDIGELVSVVLDELRKMTDGVTDSGAGARQDAASRRAPDDAGKPHRTRRARWPVTSSSTAGRWRSRRWWSGSTR